AGAAWMLGDSSTRRSARIGATVRAKLVSVATFFVVSPGTLLQPALSVSGILAAVRHYATGHNRYTVSARVDHASRMLVYIGTVLLSPFPLVAMGLTGAAVWGAAVAFRTSPRVAAIALAYPVLYMIYFSSQRTMIVRNLLVLSPFVAAFAA